MWLDQPEVSGELWVAEINLLKLNFVVLEYDYIMSFHASVISQNLKEVAMDMSSTATSVFYGGDVEADCLPFVEEIPTSEVKLIEVL